ncbi:hypothetical protein X975_18844, partial [Stegodyphus mimosarum]
MAFVDTVVSHQAQRRPSRSRNCRPPTPRVTEKAFVPKQQRTVSVASTKLAEAIRESPVEQTEETENHNRTLDVATPQERALNSPPPRPQSGIQQTENEEVQIPVPTPTTPMLSVTDLQKRAEELRAERKLKELKRDSLLQKVRDLQRRKVSTKDQAREEWRKRFLEVKKTTPR